MNGYKQILTALSLVIICFLAGCKGNNSIDSTTAAMPKNFGTLPDSTKVKLLLEQQISLDSLAGYICRAAAEDIPGVKIESLADVEAEIYSLKGERDFSVYMLAFDECKHKLPLVKKLNVYSKNTLEGEDMLGYRLGLEYVNDVMQRKLTIGKVDKEIAEFRSACGDDEDTYKRFLKGFATALQTRKPGEVSAEIISQYGTAPK